MYTLYDIEMVVLNRLKTIYNITYLGEGIVKVVEIDANDWNNSGIVNSLIRSLYSQDRVEAIINNHFLNIAEWLDKKFKGEDVTFEDPEYDKLQDWRKQCKQWAVEVLEKYPPTN